MTPEQLKAIRERQTWAAEWFSQDSKRNLRDWESIHALLAERDALQRRVERLEEALTPSGATKAAFLGEFEFPVEGYGDVAVPWTTVKEIMKAILARALSPEARKEDE